MKPNRFKFLILILLVALLTILGLGAIMVAGQGTVTAAPTAALLWLDPVEAIAVTGSSTIVDLELSDISNVFGIEVYMAFDPSILSVVGEQVTEGTCPSPDFTVANTADNVLGTIEYATTQLSLPSCDGGTVASIEFLCAAGLQSEVTTPITITASIISDPDGVAITHGTQNGAVRCEANIFFIDGVVELQAWPSAAGVQVDLKDGSGATVDSKIVAADGAFGFTGTTGETYSVEASYDRYLTSAATGITSSVVGERVNLGTGKLRAGDVNGDGVINILDISGVAGNFGKASPQGWAP
jgi:hypothetical protein